MRGVYKTKNYEIRYLRTNRSRHPIFLIQPFPGSEVAYQPLIDELLKVNPKADFVNFTLPGLGGKNRLIAKNIHLKIEDYAKIIQDFIDSFRPESYSVIACSLGGFMAGWMLSHRLINPKKVLLLSPFMDSKKLLTHSLKFQRLLLTGAFKLGFSLRALLSVNNIYIWLVEWRKHMTAFSNRLIPKALKDFEKINVEESFYLFDELLNLGEQEIREHKNKMLVLYGDRDIPDVITDCKKLEKEGYQVKNVKDGTHGYVFNDPVQTAGLVSGFLFN